MMQRRNMIGTAILAALVAGIIIYFVTRPSETEMAAALRARFAEALSQEDHEKAASAANEFSRLRGRTLEPAATFEEMFPIGSTAAYPLTSLEISADFVRRRLFYSRIAASIARGKLSESDRVLAAFDWTVRNAWPVHTWSQPSGQNPEEIALTGTGSPEDLSWLFCTVLENLGQFAMLLNYKLKGIEEVISYVAVGVGETERKWYLFAPDRGLPLLKEDGRTVATIDDFYSENARIPGMEPVRMDDIEGIRIMLASEAQTFLPAAGDLEKLLKEKDYELVCYRTIADLQDHSDSLFKSLEKREKPSPDVGYVIWWHPFQLTANGKALDHAGTTPLDDLFFKARSLYLTGKLDEALKQLGSLPVEQCRLLLAAVKLTSGDSEGSLKALDGFTGKDYASDMAAFIAGEAYSTLDRPSDTAESFRKMRGPREALGTFLADKVEKQEKVQFILAGE